MEKRIRAVIWHEQLDTRQKLRKAVESLGHEVVAEGSDGDRLVAEVITQPQIDLILCGMSLEKRDAISCLLAIAESRPVPAIICTDEKSLHNIERAMEDHVMAYLVEPINVAQIRPTLHLVLRRFEEYQSLKEEIEDLRERMEARRSIERAKGVIMRRRNVGEEIAYEALRKLAMDERIKLVEAAERVLNLESTKS